MTEKEKQDKQTKQTHFPKFTFDDVLALQCCMETVKKVQEDKELYEKLNLIHSKMYDAYQIEKQDEQASSQNNENINLTKILKDCPKGWKFWSPIFGEVEFVYNYGEKGFVNVSVGDGTEWSFASDATIFFGNIKSREVMLYPSKELRDWSKFTAPWYKNERKGKFDPKTLKAFDKVIIRHDSLCEWEASLFSHRNIYYENEDIYSFCTVTDRRVMDCIPYNDDTKHLVGTYDEVPEFYRYWEE